MLERLTASPLWHTAGWTMLHYVWVGLSLGLIAVMGRWLLRRAHPNSRYVFAMVCLTALAVAPVTIAIRVCDSSAVVGASLESHQSIRNAHLASPRPAHATIDLDVVPLATSRPFAERAAPAAASDITARIPAIMNSVAIWLPALWLVCVPLILVHLTTGLVGADRLRRQSQLLEDGHIVQLCRRLSGTVKIRRAVTVAVCDRLVAPILVGIIRPVILLPPAAVAGWSPAQLEMILLHELAHVRRWDNLVNLLQRVIESLLFFHPAVWFVSNWVRKEREHCCDEFVLSRQWNRQDYARVLASFVNAAQTAIGQTKACDVTDAVSSMARGHLVARIRHVLRKGEEPMQVSRKSIGFVLVLLVLFAVLTGWHRMTLHSAGGAEPSRLSDLDEKEDSPSSETAPREEDASTTFVTAIVDQNGRREVWLLQRATGERMTKLVGDTILIQGVAVGKISRIDTKVIELTGPADEKLLVRIGENLEQAKRSVVAPVESDMKPTTTVTGEVRWLGEISGIAPTQPAKKPISVDRCVVSFMVQSQLTSVRTGVLESVVVREGDSVKAGQELARLKDDAQRAAAAVAEAKARNDVQLRYTQKSSEVAKVEYEKAKYTNSLVSGTIPEIELARLKKALEKSTLAIELAQYEFGLSGLLQEESRVALQACTLNAPFDGIITGVHKSKGEGVREGDPVLELVSTDRVKVEGYLEARHRRSVKPGDPVTVRLAYETQSPSEDESVTFAGRVVFVDVSVNPVLQRVRVWAEVANPDNILAAGLSATMTIHPQSKPGKKVR